MSEDGWERVLTDRLDLRIPDPDDDAGALFAIFNDASGSVHEPYRRHRELGQTEDWLRRAALRFGTDRLSYWTVRRRGSGEIVGVGGAQRQRTGAWNLSYRIAGTWQGNGFATELGSTALRAAHRVDDDVAVIAWIVASNVPSRRVAERLGLTEQGPAIDPSDGRTRLAYADRPLGDFHG